MEPHANSLASPRDIKLSQASGRFLQRVIEGNYFYVLSAALMLYGSYLLMRSPVITGTEFTRTLKTLLVLQGYELLVIVAAVAIVRRLKILDDAFTLLLIELVLLLDPTFFTNSFYTMTNAASGWVNVACSVLAPIKLAVLLAALRIRLDLRAWAAFVFAVVFVYLAEGPLCMKEPKVSHAFYYYLIAWAPVCFAAILPAVPRIIVSVGGGEDYLPKERRGSLNIVLLALPLFMLVSHTVESAHVFRLRYYLFHLSPLALAAGVLLIRNLSAERLKPLVVLIDAAAIAALAVSCAFWDQQEGVTIMVQGKTVTLPPPAFVAARVPLMFCGLGVVGLYFLFYVKTRRRSALYRPLAFVIAAAAWTFGTSQTARVAFVFSKDMIGEMWNVVSLVGLTFGYVTSFFGWLGEVFAVIGAGFAWLSAEIRSTFAIWGAGLYWFTGVMLSIFAFLGAAFGWLFDIIGSGFGFWWGVVVACFQWVGQLFVPVKDGMSALEFSFIELGDWILNHIIWFCWGAWFVLLALSIRYRRYGLWLSCGLLLIWLVAGFDPETRLNWFGEMLQAFFILLLVLAHAFSLKWERQSMYSLAFIVAGVGLGRLVFAPQPVTGGFVAVEFLLLILGGLRYRYFAYLAAAVMQAIVCAAAFYVHKDIHIPYAVLVVGCALTLFAMGIVVTFNKKRLTTWLDTFAIPEPPSLPPYLSSPPAPPVEKPTPEPDSVVDEEPEEEPVSEKTVEEEAPEPEPEEPSAVEFIESLFPTSEASDIYLTSDLPSEQRAKVESLIEWEPDEAPVVAILLGGPNPQGRAILTDRRILCKAPQRDGASAIRYSQIKEARAYAKSVSIKSHSGEVFLLSHLSINKAQLLAIGLSVIAERAESEFVVHVESKTVD